MRDEILDTYIKICSLKNLNPCKKNNYLFSKLVYLVFDPAIKNTLKPNQLKRLRKVCSKAEYFLELFWAKKLINSKNVWKELKLFPYFHNYRKLTELEWFTLKGCEAHQTHKKVTFIGGGPLPLTAILLSKLYEVNVVVLEKNLEACQISRLLINKLGLSEKIKIIFCNGEDYKNYGDSDVIILAALAGESKESKKLIIRQIEIFSKNKSHILARSSYGKRKMLYLPIDNSSLGKMEKILEIRPLNDIVNSTIILRNKKLNLIKPYRITEVC